MTDFGTVFGWTVVALVGCIIVWELAATWAAMRAHAQTGEWLLASGGPDEDEDDGPLYPKLAPLGDVDSHLTYPQRQEGLYDVRTYPERADERIARLEDAVRKLERRLAALEGGL